MYIMIIIIVMILLGLQDGVQAQGQLQRKDGNDGGDGGGNGHPHRMQHQGQILGKIAHFFMCLVWTEPKNKCCRTENIDTCWQQIAALCAKYHPAVYLYCAGLFEWTQVLNFDSIN